MIPLHIHIVEASFLLQIFMFLKFMFASYSIAFVFSLMFEIPMRNVLNAKLLIQKDAKSQ